MRERTSSSRGLRVARGSARRRRPSSWATHLGVDGGAAVADPADGGQELADVGHPVLEQVADALGAAGEQVVA
jgi:hypothetical protein